MKFNTKYIFQGDSKKVVVDKINYNFNQILSFGVGPDGNSGAMGATGIVGAAGKKGKTGATGERASQWDIGTNQPTGSNQYDLWIKDDGDLDSYSATGSWNFTGFNFLNSLYFKSYNWIQGPAGVTDKYVIGFKDTFSASDYSFVVADSNLSSTNSNPNKSKLVISTEDQINRPILTLSKSGSSSPVFPSFYWSSLGASNDIIFKSGGNMNIISYLPLRITTATSGRILLDANKVTINSQARANFTGIGDLLFNTNTTVGGGSALTINSTTLDVTTSSFYHKSPLYIRTYNFGLTGGYALNSAPSTPLLNGGIRLEVSAVAADRIFRINDLSGSSVLSARPYSTLAGSGDMGQTVFGSTGSSAGATAGPYSYHVSKVNLLRSNTTTRTARAASSNCLGKNLTRHNVFVLDQNSFQSNIIVITPTSYTTSKGTGVYIELPTSYLSNLSGVYSSSFNYTYRIMLNNEASDPLDTYLVGIVYNFWTSTSTACYHFKNFNSGTDQTCRYVDLTYLPPANTYNQNPRIFYKTCNGTSGYVNLGSVYIIQSPPLIPPAQLV